MTRIGNVHVPPDIDPEARAEYLRQQAQERAARVYLKDPLELPRCPHCGIDKPNLARVQALVAHQGGRPRFWGTYVCARCGGAVLAGGSADGELVEHVYPAIDTVPEAVPARARTYLEQAMSTIHAPAASIMAAASAVDAMLKARNYKKGSLYDRIERAAKEHLITAEMAEWAHEVRLDANEQRHDDEEAPLASEDDARRAVAFTRALADFLFVLPARVAAGRQPTAPVSPTSPHPTVRSG